MIEAAEASADEMSVPPPEVRLLMIAGRREDGERVLLITIAAPKAPSAELARDLAGIAGEELGEDLVVRVETRLSAEVR